MCHQFCESPAFFVQKSATQHKFQGHISEDMFYKTCPRVYALLRTLEGREVYAGAPYDAYPTDG